MIVIYVNIADTIHLRKALDKKFAMSFLQCSSSNSILHSMGRLAASTIMREALSGTQHQPRETTPLT